VPRTAHFPGRDADGVLMPTSYAVAFGPSEPLPVELVGQVLL
jgi:hypothetical protein